MCLKCYNTLFSRNYRYTYILLLECLAAFAFFAELKFVYYPMKEMKRDERSLAALLEKLEKRFGKCVYKLIDPDTSEAARVSSLTEKLLRFIQYICPGKRLEKRAKEYNQMLEKTQSFTIRVQEWNSRNPYTILKDPNIPEEIASGIMSLRFKNVSKERYHRRMHRVIQFILASAAVYILHRYYSSKPKKIEPVQSSNTKDNLRENLEKELSEESTPELRHELKEISPEKPAEIKDLQFVEDSDEGICTQDSCDENFDEYRQDDSTNARNEEIDVDWRIATAVDSYFPEAATCIFVSEVGEFDHSRLTNSNEPTHHTHLKFIMKILPLKTGPEAVIDYEKDI
ncbi:hypothetical protein SK128_022533 [Halocaridina rubra]|uniref:Uncharacterized protein n=1 Tax=Halocaridina rubra TaxID=373956 RepID=A0AAN8XCC7_HALRR